MRFAYVVCLLLSLASTALADGPKLRLAVTQFESERTSFSYSDVASVRESQEAEWSLVKSQVGDHEVQVFIEEVGSGKRRPVQMVRRKNAKVEAKGIRRMPSGTLLIAGEERRSGESALPSVWLHRPGSSPDDWVQVVLEPKHFVKEQRKKIRSVKKIIGFELDTEELIVIVTLDTFHFVTARVAIGIEWPE